jgi:fused signal recognition particle receptor
VKLTRKELLAPEVVEVMAAAGLQATLDEETEIELKDYVALLIKLEVAALAKAADETKQAQDVAAAEEAKVLADAQLANEVKAAEEAAHLIETETKAAMAALEETIVNLTAKAAQV